MNKEKLDSMLQHEERRALLAYLLSFYITLALYDVFYYYLYPIFILKTEPGLIGPFSYWNYVIFISLVPISYLLAKRNKLHAIKYLYILVYMGMTALGDMIMFSGESGEYQSGNVAELTLLLFSPIFVNNRFYWTVTAVSLLRYLTVGIVIESAAVVIPMAIISILSVIAYIFMKRFSSYIFALTSIHEKMRHKEKLAFIGQMAASIGHEIKNPLASLKGFTQLQKEKYEDDQQYFSIMEQEIDRINSIVNDLLVLGKPRAVQFQRKNINDILTYVISITEQLARQKGITLTADLDENIPPVVCDENQLKQAFINLIKNGVDSMSDGGLLKVYSHYHTGNTLSVSFVDQGCGIEPSNMERLFAPFYTTKIDGTGLGLMVTKKIVEDHQGQIKVDSELNKGTKVDMILPIEQ
ncbi:ATP-binding protein [Bacillus sp. DTU_2020_1000418_1_SI_GHA_SEK_038]|uniref:ATP-binding protein n=1 Tax=Bacillus sp. DTU_2020_1000418_1_SI_GHA_SEK_038 TaxID=3077585 RepID=UPI0028EFBE2E|nr:ATP-binding protein [Bacillus sp. DTU_2020_1000418_1_SI_GHA_SEK_038]WNS76592.1 ATP-binding protein [Bacillus sp. DTU_2020_1000418_1_SI_GHA_SEK_038]